ncbi:DUF1391 domain-containing protein [Salmonella enterica subsp. enterica serovar Poona]|nr:DUF1391 domain-containing protein [Salmonella enterica]EAS6892655.1 DUF1391 domain-containing protein [Salmonella enterica subsp. enterica serovar Poona]ECI1616077.1 DUF1391 domain-containing protein [Salmonella enterica subsp. enterica serovar Give]ECJ3906670.1 DUF1391 domain-containing protein [Salmonella enterica subsp. enterica serovar Poona]ECM0137094.1 DUF1391 domain-containing protein [Salmonella enterica subsp. enterica serovar Give]
MFRHPALRGNEVNMDTIDPGNNESLVCGVFPNQDGTFTAMTYTKSKTFKSEAGALWRIRELMISSFSVDISPS